MSPTTLRNFSSHHRPGIRNRPQDEPWRPALLLNPHFWLVMPAILLLPCLVGCGGNVGQGNEGSTGSAGDAGTAKLPCTPKNIEGTWALSYEAAKGNCNSLPSNAMKLMRLDANGEAINASFVDAASASPVKATFQPDTCSAQVTYSKNYIAGGEMNGESFDLGLRFAGETAVGILRYCRYWDCNYDCVMTEHVMSATRTAP